MKTWLWCRRPISTSTVPRRRRQTTMVAASTGRRVRLGFSAMPVAVPVAYFTVEKAVGTR